jgi:hypothetical protein
MLKQAAALLLLASTTQAAAQTIPPDVATTLNECKIYNAKGMPVNWATPPQQMPHQPRDHTDQLQKQITNAARGILILSPGDYWIDHITLPAEGIILVGSNTVLRRSRTVDISRDFVTIPSHSNNISLVNMTFDLDSSTTNTHANAIASQGNTKYITICRTTIRHVPRNAIVIRSGDRNWRIQRNDIEHVRRFGVVVDFLKTPAHNIIVKENNIRWVGESPIAFIASSGGENDQPSAGVIGSTIAGNKVAHTGQGIGGYSPNNRDVNIVSNRIEHVGIGRIGGHGTHWGGTNIHIKNNIIRNTNLSAIFFAAWPNGAARKSGFFSITGNSIHNVTANRNGQGIAIRQAPSGLIARNTIQSAFGPSIDIQNNISTTDIERVILVSNIIIRDRCHNQSKSAREIILSTRSISIGTIVRDLCGTATPERNARPGFSPQPPAR